MNETTPHVDVVFDRPPGPESPCFVETEDVAGRSIKFGAWVDRGDGSWALRLTEKDFSVVVKNSASPRAYRYAAMKLLHDRATRLAHLVELGAPDQILEGEIQLILDARDRWREESKHDWPGFDRARRVHAHITESELDELIKLHVGDVGGDPVAKADAILEVPDAAIRELYARHEREIDREDAEKEKAGGTREGATRP